RVVTGFEPTTDPETGETVQKPIYDQRVADKFDDLYKTVVKADKEYSNALGCKASIKHTTVKPSGKVAKLAGLCEAIHVLYAGHLIRRIRFQDSDPLLPVLKVCGYKIEPDIYTKHTMCVEFPVKAENADDPNFASAGSVSIAEQFATQAFLQTYWSDNAVSCTVTFQPNEAKEIAPLMYQYRNTTKSTSLLPYSGGEFKQAPKEPIDKKIYQERESEIKGNV